MKNKHSLKLSVIALAITSLLVTSCDLFPSFSSITSKSSNIISSIASDTSISYSSPSSSTSQAESFTSNQGSLSNDSSSNSISSTNPNITRIVDLFASNDFHGAIKPAGYEMGAIKNFTYLKQKGTSPNTVVMGSGDFFQGSIESNYNRGALITELMMEANFTAYVLGNHDFDWGSSYIARNRNLTPQVSSATRKIPFLGANIHEFDIATKTVGDFADELCEPYTTKILENGLKVGIIGTIGADQITSIVAKYADPYTFLEPATYVKKYSDELREAGCDVVIWNNHASMADTISSTRNYDLTQLSPVSGERYVDAVFCSHSHAFESNKINGVPVVQAGYNGRGIARVTLSVSPNGSVFCDLYTTYYTSDLLSSLADDSVVKQIVDHYGNETTPIANKVIGTSNGVFARNNSSGGATVPNLVVAAAADFINKSASLNNLGITAVISNLARDDLPSGNITYSNLFKSIPFDNNILIMNVKGSDIIKEIQYKSGSSYANSTYLFDTNQKYNTNVFYRIAVLDYVGTHRNISRNYDYFSSLSSGGGVLGSINAQGGMSLNNEVNEFNYRDITEKYIESLPNKQLNTANYIYNTGNFNVDNISI